MSEFRYPWRPKDEDELVGNWEPPNVGSGNQAPVFWENSESVCLQNHLFIPLGTSFEDIMGELQSSEWRHDLTKYSLH